MPELTASRLAELREMLAASMRPPWMTEKDLPGIVSTREPHPRTVCGCGRHVAGPATAKFIEAIGNSASELFDLAQEALAKREMVEVKNRMDGMGYRGIDNPNFIGRCGACGSVVTSLDKFCRECGKRIQWQTKMRQSVKSSGVIEGGTGKNSPADELLRALKTHLTDLADAWQRGALQEYDGKGGTRSNRNHDLLLAVSRYEEALNGKS